MKINQKIRSKDKKATKKNQMISKIWSG